MRLALMILAVCLTILATPPAYARSPALLPSIGQTVSDSIDLLGKTIPLPRGNWVVASAGFGHASETDGSDPTPVGGVLLIRSLPDADRAFVLLHTNALPVRSGWGTPEECDSPAALARNAAEPVDLHHACSFVLAARGARRMMGDTPAAAGRTDLAEHLPPWALIAGLRVSDRRDFVDMRLGVAPPSPTPGGWFADAMDTEHQAAVQRISDWARAARPIVAQAMRGPLSDTKPLSFPILSAETGIAGATDETSAMMTGVYKLATYRVLSSSQSWLLATMLSGSLATGSSVAFWQGLTHSAVYLGNDWAWEWPRPAPRTVLLGSTPARPGMPVDDGGQTVTIAGKQAALPNGKWVEIARTREGAIEAVAVARIDAKRLSALAVLRANTDPTSDIVGAPPDCGRSDLPYVVIRFDTPRDGYCAYVKPIATSLGQTDANGSANPIWLQALTRLRNDGVAIPATLNNATARARTRTNFLDARYYFPAETVDVTALQAWTLLLQEPMELGLRGRLEQAGLTLPSPSEEPVHAAVTRIRRLQAAGAIDQTEADRLIAAHAASIDAEHQAWSLWKRSAYKIVSYRIAATIDSLAVSWVITGSVYQTLAYAGINIVIKPFLAYANEIAWAGAGVGKPKASLLSADFADIGTEIVPPQ